MKSPYAPPHHPVADNVWHTLLSILAVAFLVWGASVQVTDLLQEGSGNVRLVGPMGALMESLDGISEEDPDLLWAHLVGLLGWIMALGTMSKSLRLQGGMANTLPSLAVLLCFPGLMASMVQAGALGVATCCFLRGVRESHGEGLRSTWIRTGIWLGCSVILDPVWMIPALLCIGGVFEARPHGWVKVAVSLFSTLLLGGMIWILAPSADAPAVFVPEPFIASMFARDVFLWSGLFLMLGFGLFRRGVGWWSLVGTLVLPVMGLVQGSVTPAAWVPLLVLVSMGLARLPSLLDIRYPRVYQSVLLCQLLLWIPYVLPPQAEDLPPEAPSLETTSDEP